MDSPIVSQLFRRLFRHPACQARRNWAQLVTTMHHVRNSNRHLSSRRGSVQEARNESSWQQRTVGFPPDKSAEYSKYDMVTAKELRTRRQRPRRVKMLMRDFIEDSLYNPNYGYFSKQVVIFSPGEPFDFGRLWDEVEFQEVLSRRYVEFEDALDEMEGGRSDSRQLWYTPTELFRPYYGEAIAQYLVENYRISHYPYHDLNIYEMGAGRGTLMLNILDWIREYDEAVYERTRYNVIEISSQLASLQRSQSRMRGHAAKVDVINRSILDWTEPEPSPCFFLAFEVFDNLAHDVVRYDVATERPLQGVVLIDGDGDFYEFYEPVLDPVAARFMRVRHLATKGQYPVPYPASRLGRWWSLNRPFAPNLSAPEYIPTRLMQFFDVLYDSFPAHRLLTSDFHRLPGATPGLNAPVVQTRHERRPIPVTTPLVHQGYFDIMFPTDFAVAQAMYQLITRKFTAVRSHESFMRSWADLDRTETKRGENPLLRWYKNASVMYTL